eukprot:Rhum_TRINITY_DN15045_c5_g1::Rhum_TRINITY_DN15045_c5_g1_i6::g.135098::m.135098
MQCSSHAEQAANDQTIRYALRMRLAELSHRTLRRVAGLRILTPMVRRRVAVVAHVDRSFQVAAERGDFAAVVALPHQILVRMRRVALAGLPDALTRHLRKLAVRTHRRRRRTRVSLTPGVRTRLPAAAEDLAAAGLLAQEEHEQLARLTLEVRLRQRQETPFLVLCHTPCLRVHLRHQRRGGRHLVPDRVRLHHHLALRAPQQVERDLLPRHERVLRAVDLPQQARVVVHVSAAQLHTRELRQLVEADRTLVLAVLAAAVLVLALLRVHLLTACADAGVAAPQQSRAVHPVFPPALLVAARGCRDTHRVRGLRTRLLAEPARRADAPLLVLQPRRDRLVLCPLHLLCVERSLERLCPQCVTLLPHLLQAGALRFKRPCRRLVRRHTPRLLRLFCLFKRPRRLLVSLPPLPLCLCVQGVNRRQRPCRRRIFPLHVLCVARSVERLCPQSVALLQRTVLHRLLSLSLRYERLRRLRYPRGDRCRPRCACTGAAKVARSTHLHVGSVDDRAVRTRPRSGRHACCGGGGGGGSRRRGRGRGRDVGWSGVTAGGALSLAGDVLQRARAAHPGCGGGGACRAARGKAGGGDGGGGRRAHRCGAGLARGRPALVEHRAQPALPACGRSRGRGGEGVDVAGACRRHCLAATELRWRGDRSSRRRRCGRCRNACALLEAPVRVADTAHIPAVVLHRALPARPRLAAARPHERCRDRRCGTQRHRITPGDRGSGAGHLAHLALRVVAQVLGGALQACPPVDADGAAAVAVLHRSLGVLNEVQIL